MSEAPNLVQDAAGTFISTSPDHDDGGRRAYHGLQDSIAEMLVQLPSSAQIQLWEKATTDHDSLTSDERLQVLERWPLKDFNDRCRAICGITFEDLLGKAAQSSRNLTREQANVVI